VKIDLPIQEGTFRKRYKRFFADIEFQDETITAHVPNTGSLKGCLKEGQACRFSVSDDPKRKLPYTLLMVKSPSSWVGVNTNFANHLVWEAYQNGYLWKTFKGGQKEVKISDKSRIDMVVWKANKLLPTDKKISRDDFADHKFHFVEIKNVTMCEGGTARFPDAVTTRGQKHIDELVELIEQGHTGEFVFVVQRQDAKVFKPADDIDPEYGRKLREAKKKGLKITALACKMKKSEVQIDPVQKLKVVL
jgi:sugar fermentation stimulation protein A